MIPKKIFFVWLGNNKPNYVNYTISKFKELNPTFNIELIEYNISELEYIGDIEKGKMTKTIKYSHDWLLNLAIHYTKEKYKEPKLKINYFIKILIEIYGWFLVNYFGGLYISCNCFPIKPFDDEFLSTKKIQCTTINNCFIKLDKFMFGCMKDHSESETTLLNPIIDDLPTDYTNEFINCRLNIGDSYNNNQYCYVDHFSKINNNIDICKYDRFINYKICVYTCITGEYDKLKDIKYKCDLIDYICFTDNPNLKHKDWIIKPLPEEIRNSNLSNVKKQRLIKILPHKYLKEYDISLWIDANIEANYNLYKYICLYNLDKNCIYTLKHPLRNCIYSEISKLIDIRYDKKENLQKINNYLLSEKYPTNNGLSETGVILRKHNDPLCINICNLWSECILKYSHRDQTSFNYCAWIHNYNVKYLDRNYFKIKSHYKQHLLF